MGSVASSRSLSLSLGTFPFLYLFLTVQAGWVWRLLELSCRMDRPHLCCSLTHRCEEAVGVTGWQDRSPPSDLSDPISNSLPGTQ